MTASEVEKLESYLRRATTALVETEKELSTERAARTEPIAVVSMACRLPGGIDTPEGFWELLSSGGDAIGPFPSRWENLDLYDPDPEAVGKSYAREGGFVDGVEDFDAAFFGISPREAQSMDPQQRLVLEASWEALERAGIRPDSLRESRTGVYLGAMSADYGNQQGHDLEALDGYVSTGNASSVVSGRVSYALGLQGPAVTVDTACSSSLVALHLAATALRQGECDLALVGGVTVMSTPSTFVEFSRLKGASADGRSKSFSGQADGTGLSEGAGVLVLKRLSAAERDGDRVLAVIRGSAVNQDGASNGLTAPNGPSQQRVIHDALAFSQLTPADIDAIEAHGTGTSLGDPIEAGALAEVFGEHRVFLGSAKSNLGHTQAAAGVVGVMKMILALQHETLPRTLHADEPSPHIDWDSSGLTLLQHDQPWHKGERTRRAGISSFGLSGTNAHVVLEEAPAVVPAEPSQNRDRRLPALPVVVSGRDEGALRDNAARLADWLESRGGAEPDLADVAFSAARRTRFERRAGVVAASVAETVAGLRAVGEGRSATGVVTATATPSTAGGVAFLFPGQGSQRAGMGRELYDAFRVFAEAFDQICAVVDGLLGRSLKDVVFGSDATALERTEFAQPGLFAFEVALFRLWESWGLSASVVAGHSVGELAAAHVAGVLSLEDAARLVVARGRLMQTCEPGGVMASVEAAEAEVVAVLQSVPGQVSVAGVNGPAQVVVSGDAASVEQVEQHFAGEGRRTRRLEVSHAFHSAHMDTMLDEFAEIATGCRFAEPRIPLVSSVTGAWMGRDLAASEGMRSPAYWVTQVREAVRFWDAVRTLEDAGPGRYVECGPRAVLTAMGSEGVAEESAGRFVASARRGAGEVAGVLNALTELHVLGQDIDWTPLFEGTGATRIDLPTYAFQRERFWQQVSTSGDVASVGLEAAGHPWLGAVTALADGEGHVFSGRVSLRVFPWLADHAVFGTVIVPGTALLELALSAGYFVGAGRVEELTLLEALVVPEEGELRLQATVGAPAPDGRRPFALYSRRGDDGEWTRHAAGELSETPVLASDGFEALAQWPVPGAQRVDLDGFYERLDTIGIEYGLAFRGLSELWRDGDTAYGLVHLPEDVSTDGYGIHPALLDTALHTLIAAAGEQSAGDSVLLPFEWAGVSLEAVAGSVLRVRAEMDSETSTARIQVADENGSPVARIEGLQVRQATSEQIRAAATSVDHLYRVEFRPVTAGSPPARDADRLVIDARGWSGSVTEVAGRGLAELQQALADEAVSEIVLVTCGAVGEDATNVGQASLWGLVRSARSEHPERMIRLIDTDTDDLTAALHIADEPELVVRDGQVLSARLVRASADADTQARALDPAGTVLITGGTGELGQALARHLVREHGVRRLVLTSRRGADAPGVSDLVGELTAAGADSVEVVACDVADRAQVRNLLTSTDTAHPWTGVFHLAAVLDDGLLADQNPDRLTGVLAPKTESALHLHHLTRELGFDLAAFVLYSSASGVLGSPGQSTYAAANTALDTLATHRRGQGLAATSLSWGLWQQAGIGLTAALGQADVARMRRQGFGALTQQQALAALDAALLQPHAHLVPIKLETARVEDPPALLRALVRRKRTRPTAGAATSGGRATALRDLLVALPEAERLPHLVQLVREEASVVLGASSAEGVGDHQAFKELGLDSLMAVELRRRLSAATEVALPATLAFDYPTPAAVAGLLLDRLDLATVTVAASRPSATPALGHGTADDPIAVVSMACRLPGGIDTPEGFWDLLSSGGDAIGPFPSRWENLDLYDPDPEAVGKSYTREGGFLDGVEDFDAAFFGISPREAQSMDPQQRLVLEASWEALERAGIRPDSLRESRTGVYLGAMSSDYDRQGQGLDALDGYMSTGNASSVISGRISYALGLQGPAVTIDTACSSSLVALHLAAGALRQGECDLALVGGVTVMSTPSTFVEFSRLKGTAKDGRCKSFSARADGAIWAEGAGVLVLKRLSAAERDGDRVLAVIRGSSVNQDGASNGLTAPNGPSQQRVIHDALAAARLAPADIDAIEAHGTGTSLGDPIEAGALAEVFGEQRVFLGSAKSNLGHTQAAAGVVGVMKMILALQHETLPRTLHADEPSPHIEWDRSGLTLLQHDQPWQKSERTRRAGISSFGLSGTNAHVLIEEAPTATHAPASAATVEPSAPAVVPLVVSGTDEDALRAQAGRWADWLIAHPDTPLRDVAATAATRRTHLEHRAGAVAETAAEAVAALRALVDGVSHPQLVTGTARDRGKAVFVFPGQGSQWRGMGRQLLVQSPVFREAVEECDAALLPWTGWSVLALLAAPESGLSDDALPPFDRIDVLQPALFTVMIGLAAQWRALGVEPAAVVGSSQGEVPAAVVAGALSLEDGARLVALRSQALLRECSGRGAMALLELPVAEVEELIAPYGDALSVAVVNTATSTVVSGDADAVERLLTEMEGREVFCRRVQSDAAGHSAHMDPILPALAADLAGLRPRAWSVPFCSTVTGTVVDGDTLDAAYWCRNLRETVRLDRALQSLSAAGFGVFVEISPHPVLGMPLTDACAAGGGVVVGSLARERGDMAQLLRSLAVLHSEGHPVDFRAFLPEAATPVELPTYAFQRQRYWPEPAAGRAAGAGDAGSLGLVASGHSWLGAATTVADGDGHLLTGRISTQDQPWLADHAITGTVLVPGTGLLDMALAAARAVGAARVGELTLAQPLVLHPGVPMRLQVRVGAPDDRGRRSLSVHSRPENTADTGTWTRHATGELDDSTNSPAAGALSGPAWPAAGDGRIDLGGFYERCHAQGLQYGPLFQGLTEAWRSGDALYGVVRLPGAAPGTDTASASAVTAAASDTVAGHGIHPALLDAALHLLAAAGPVDAGDGKDPAEAGSVLMPFAWRDVELHATGGTELRIRAEHTGENTVRLLVADTTGEPVLTVGGLEARRADTARLREAAAGQSGSEDLYRIHYRQLALDTGTGTGTPDTGTGTPDTGTGTPDTGTPDTGGTALVGTGGIAGAWLGVTPAATGSSLPDFGEVPPSRIVVDLTGTPAGTPAGTPDTPAPDAARPAPDAQEAQDAVVRALHQVQSFLSDPLLDDCEIVWITRDAVAARPEDPAASLTHAPLAGLLRAVRAEHPARSLRLVDVGSDVSDPGLLARALAVVGEPELVLRGETVLVPRLQRTPAPDPRTAPEPGGAPWHLDIRERGRLDTFEFHPTGSEPLPAGHIRVAVRASGMNFRDVLNALDIVYSPRLGLECAGVVVETAPDVTGLRPGDRVMGLATGTFGTEVCVDARLMVPIPAGLSFARAATVPLVFLTAYYGLHDLARLRAGERLLVHAAAGGVGMAALQLARHFGAEAYGTAGPGKWDMLRRLGLPGDRIASSRDTAFEALFRDATRGRGVDVVLNSLTGTFVDASLRLMPGGGRFLEMGKTDIRDAEQVAADHPEVIYQAYDLRDSGADRIQEMLRVIAALMEQGILAPLPYEAFDVREAPAAFRHMAQGRHVGKIVLTVPRALDTDGTALLTGGTGELGRLVAHHLVGEHGIRHLVLTSRRGPNAPGTGELVRQLKEAGAESVTVAACDVSRRDDVASVLAAVPADRPLTAVLHLAAVLDDGVVHNQSTERFRRVLEPKVAGALHLHELTEDLDLAAFVLFSSAAGTLGAPGQSNYAAANAFLDALAAHRRKRGLPAASLAWGLWAQGGTGMTAQFGDVELRRVRRRGAQALTTQEGMALLDTALARTETLLVPLKLDLTSLRGNTGEAVPLLRSLVRPQLRQVRAQAPQTESFAERLAGLSRDERVASLLTTVQNEIADVLGLADAAAVPADKRLKDFGLDSLMAVEVRNRLSKYVQAALPSTMAFDYPTPRAIADFLYIRLDFDREPEQTGPPADPAQAARWALERVSAEQLQHSGVLARLLEIAQPRPAAHAAADAVRTAAALQAAEELTADEMDQALDAVLGSL
ncbi:SDR family NAD(P)-dependent oxidoreductase [Streptomyces sp. NPDC003023]|uniref:SDR family NAD(P)-dependent oxidoreductase n=1 Tax=Streptomyces sp. NPDC003023 TaxID=3364675 RepID=UPI0036B5B20C